MDLVDRIETTRFLGAEFLLWLWHNQDSGLELRAVEHSASCELASPLLLAEIVTPTESVAVKGASACSAPEATQALLLGKLPTRATVYLGWGDQAFTLSFDALHFSMGRVQLPDSAEGGSQEERIEQRLEQLELVQDIVDDLYGQFLSIRLSGDWQSEHLPRLQGWLQGLGEPSEAALGEPPGAPTP